MAGAEPLTRDAAPDLAQRLGAHRADLLRIARLQLRDAELAADVVQETLLAALQAASGFAGRSAEKTWLVGILKHKVIDALRARLRDPVPASRLAAELDTADLERLFDGEGLWTSAPRVWDDPAGAARQREFLGVLEACLDRLPARTARVFMLRELFELDAAEVCRLVQVSQANLRVLMYRARMMLRRCVERHWLGA